MKQGKNNKDMPKLESGMVFKIEAEPDKWYLVLNHDKRLYAHIRHSHDNVGDDIVEIVKVCETAGDSGFDLDQVTRIVYERIGDTQAVNVDALTELLDRGVVGELQVEWIKASPKKKMTVAEVEKALGYGVEIVSD